MLAASIHLSRGTPYIYMGEEIGMVDPDYDSMADYVDVESINAYQMLLKKGKVSKKPSRLFRLSPEIIHVFLCSGMFQKMLVSQKGLLAEGREIYPTST